MKVIGYVRVSTAEQGVEGISLDAQRARLEAYAISQDVELVEVVEEIASAKSLQRPRLRDVLKRIESGEVGGLLITKLDRLTRRVVDLGRLLEGPFSRAALLSVGDSFNTTTAIGRFALNLLVSVAQLERETTSERTREAALHLKAQGVMLGPMPFGLIRGPERDEHGRLVVRAHPHELQTLRDILQARKQDVTMVRVAKWLNSRGLKTRQGCAWNKNAVIRATKHAPKVLAIVVAATTTTERADDRLERAKPQAEPVVAHATRSLSAHQGDMFNPASFGR